MRNKKPKYLDDPNDGGPLVLLRMARDAPKIPDGFGELIEEAIQFAADRPPFSSSALGACALDTFDLNAANIVFRFLISASKIAPTKT